MIFLLCIREIISKLLFMQEPTIVRYTCQFEQYLSHRQNERRAHPSWAPTKEPTMSCWRYTPTPKQDRFQDLLEAICPDFLPTSLTK